MKVSQAIGVALALCVAWHVFNMHGSVITSALVVLIYAIGVAKGMEVGYRGTQSVSEASRSAQSEAQK